MKRFLPTLMIMGFIAFPAYGAGDAVDRAMKLYEKRHYEEAAELRGDILALPAARQGAGNLALGMIFLKNAELYRGLSETSVSMAQDHLKKLLSGKGKNKSRLAEFYFAQVLIQAGKFGVAAAHLEKVIADESIDAHFRAIAKANLGLCYFQINEKEKAEKVWNDIDSTHPEVRSELASIYSRTAVKEKKPEALCEQALEAAKQSRKPLSTRMLANSVLVFARSGATEKGLELLKGSDVKKHSYQEIFGKTKVIHFYDPSLLANLSLLYGRASIAYLEKAAHDANLAGPASHYLGQAYLFFGEPDESLKSKPMFVSASKMPAPYKERSQAWLAASEYRNGGRKKAFALWEDLAQKSTAPDLNAEILLACGSVNGDCPQIVKRAEALAEAGQGKSAYGLNIALGKYYLSKKKHERALAFLEAGRDKSNKNKIEFNDPVMLVDLAELYYRTKKFAEALEIYFEMSKQFPAVRQIQESIQGVYAIEQKSAGDVKIF